MGKRPDARCGKRDDDRVEAYFSGVFLTLLRPPVSVNIRSFRPDRYYACPLECGGGGGGDHTADTCVADFYDELYDFYCDRDDLDDGGDDYCMADGYAYCDCMRDEGLRYYYLGCDADSGTLHTMHDLCESEDETTCRKSFDGEGGECNDFSDSDYVFPGWPSWFGSSKWDCDGTTATVYFFTDNTCADYVYEFGNITLGWTQREYHEANCDDNGDFMCYDDNDSVLDSGVATSCGDLSQYCDDESDLTAMGFPEGWFAWTCRDTCGVCNDGGYGYGGGGYGYGYGGGGGCSCECHGDGASLFEGEVHNDNSCQEDFGADRFGYQDTCCMGTSTGECCGGDSGSYDYSYGSYSYYY